MTWEPSWERRFSSLEISGLESKMFCTCPGRHVRGTWKLQKSQLAVVRTALPLLPGAGRGLGVHGEEAGEHVAVGVSTDDVGAGQGEARLLLPRHLEGQVVGGLLVLTGCGRVIRNLPEVSTGVELRGRR